MIVELGFWYVGKGVGTNVVDQVLLPEEEDVACPETVEDCGRVVLCPVEVLPVEDEADCLTTDDDCDWDPVEDPEAVNVGSELVLGRTCDEELAIVPVFVPKEDAVDSLKTDDDFVDPELDT